MIRVETMKVMSSLPGPRYKDQGNGSGEEFREDYLIPAFNTAKNRNEILEVDMDGARYGYPTSFLEEAFGGLARRVGVGDVEVRIRIICNSEPMLSREIMHYIKHANDKRTLPFRSSKLKK